MSHEIKFVYLTGRKVTYTVRQPDGTLRGLADISLTEIPPSSGYYTNNIARPDLVAGDMIIIKDSEAGCNVAQGEWKPEDGNQLQTTATSNGLLNFFLDLYERTLKAAIDAVLEKYWPK